MIRTICRKNHMQNENDWRQFSPKTLFFQASNSSSTTVVPSIRLEVWDSHPPGETRAQVTSTNRFQWSPRTHPGFQQGIFCCFSPLYVRPKEVRPFSLRASSWTAATTSVSVLIPRPQKICMQVQLLFHGPGESSRTWSQWQIRTFISFQDLIYWIKWNLLGICNFRKPGMESAGALKPPGVNSGKTWLNSLRLKFPVPHLGWFYWDIRAPIYLRLWLQCPGSGSQAHVYCSVCTVNSKVPPILHLLSLLPHPD